MKNTPLTWDDLRVLLEVHRRGSFVAAGAELGLSTSTVARRIRALERDVGNALVQRTSQGAWIESDARALIATAERFEQSLAALGRDGGVRRSPFAGVVRISLPDGFGPAAATAAARLHRAHPETDVEVIIESRFVDLAAREADIGVRGGRSTSPTLLEKPLGDVHGALYASADYLARRLPGRFLAAGDYASQAFIAKERAANGRGAAQWLSERGAGRFSFHSNSFEARVQAAEEGMGLVQMAVGAEASYPTLLRVGLEQPLPSVRFYLTMHRDLRKVPRVRALAAAMHELFREFAAEQAAAEARFAARGPRRKRR
jgi:DNA-binding transcriptional LysR family regulator